MPNWRCSPRPMRCVGCLCDCPACHRSRDRSRGRVVESSVHGANRSCASCRLASRSWRRIREYLAARSIGSRGRSLAGRLMRAQRPTHPFQAVLRVDSPKPTSLIQALWASFRLTTSRPALLRGIQVWSCTVSIAPLGRRRWASKAPTLLKTSSHTVQTHMLLPVQANVRPSRVL